MIQQVNFYQEILKQSQAGSKYKTVFWAFLALLCLLLSYCAYIAWNTHTMTSTLNLKESDLEASKATLKSLQIAFPERPPDSLLINEISNAQKKLESLSQIAHLLADPNADHNQGFSKYLQGLANQATRGIWLNTIYINSNIKIFSLKGSTIGAEQVPSFLRQLQNERAFHGKSFAKLNMEKPEARPNEIDFTVSTTTVLPDEYLP